MKTLIAAAVIGLSTLFILPATASADSYRRTIGKCNACGSTLYANRVFVGYNYARQPVFRYIPVGHSCKRHDSHRGHDHRDDHRRDYDRHRGHDHHDHDRDRRRSYGNSRYDDRRSGASFWFRIGG